MRFFFFSNMSFIMSAAILEYVIHFCSNYLKISIIDAKRFVLINK